MEEIWVDIIGYEGFYQVSNTGKVRSVDRSIKYSNGKVYVYKGKELSLKYRKDGYYTACLCKNSDEKNLFVHRLIAFAFIPKVDNKPFINHKNGVKTDNRIENLEWCDYSDNNKHAYDTGLNSTLKGEKSHFSKLKSADIYSIRNMYHNWFFTKWELADIYKMTYNSIHNILIKKTWFNI